jgi:hypothetical protein
MAEFMNKYNLGISGAMQHQAQNLGSDLLNLFGAVGKGADTYNQIGAFAAKLDFADKQRQSLEELSSINVALSAAKESNDVEAMNLLMQRVDDITSSITADREKYSNHKAAYETYSELSLDYGSQVRSKYQSSIGESIIQANKVNRFNNVSYRNTKLSQSGLSVSIKDIELDAESVAMYGQESQLQIVKQSTDHNMDNAYGQLKVNPSKFAAENNLFVKDKKGNVVFNSDFRKSLADKYFAQVAMKDDKFISSSKYIGENQVREVEEFMNVVFNMFNKEDGDIKNPRADTLLKDLNADLTGMKDGTVQIHNQSQTEKYKELKDLVDNGQVGKSQKQQFEQFNSDSPYFTQKAKVASDKMVSAFSNQDFATMQKLSATGDEHASSTMYKNMFQNQAQALDAQAQAFIDSGDYVNAARAMLTSNQAFVSSGTGTSQTYKFMDEIANGNVVPRNVNDIYASIEFIKYKNQNLGQTQIGKRSKIPINAIYANMVMEKVDSATKQAKTLYPNSPEKQFSHINASFIQARRAGLDDFEIAYNSANKVMTQNIGKSGDILNDYFNIGSTKNINRDTKDYFAYLAGQTNTIINSVDEMEEFMTNNSVRLSTMFFQSAISAPKLYTQAGTELKEGNYNALIQQSMRDVGIDPLKQNIGLSNVHMSMQFDENSLEPRIRFDFVSDNGSILKGSQYYSADDIIKFKQEKAEGKYTIGGIKKGQAQQKSTFKGSSSGRRR